MGLTCMLYGSPKVGEYWPNAPNKRSDSHCLTYFCRQGKHAAFFAIAVSANCITERWTLYLAGLVALPWSSMTEPKDPQRKVEQFRVENLFLTRSRIFKALRFWCLPDRRPAERGGIQVLSVVELPTLSSTVLQLYELRLSFCFGECTYVFLRQWYESTCIMYIRMVVGCQHTMARTSLMGHVPVPSTGVRSRPQDCYACQSPESSSSWSSMLEPLSSNNTTHPSKELSRKPVAENKMPVYHKVAHSFLTVAHNDTAQAFQVHMLLHSPWGRGSERLSVHRAAPLGLMAGSSRSALVQGYTAEGKMMTILQW